MVEFGGVRITGFDTFDVLVRDKGLTYVLPFSHGGGRLYDTKKSYGSTIEECGEKGFMAWCMKRWVSHSGTDMA